MSYLSRLGRGFPLLVEVGMFRHPRTTQEVRARIALDADGLSRLTRGGRSRKTLPNEWDVISPRPQRTWKKYRRTRYK